MPAGVLSMVSRSSAAFRDRTEAGRLLAGELSEYRGGDAVVLGIPRGGVVVAMEIAQALDIDLDIVLSRKLGAPGNPELAIGSVAEDGRLFLDDDLLDALGVDPGYISLERDHQLQRIHQMQEKWRRVCPKARLGGRVVIVTDDGLATGATMQAALWTARLEKPKELVCALPVGPEDSVGRLTEYADKVVCLRVPPYFSAVGQAYKRFGQVEDAEVMDILGEACAKRKGEGKDET